MNRTRLSLYGSILLHLSLVWGGMVLAEKAKRGPAEVTVDLSFLGVGAEAGAAGDSSAAPAPARKGPGRPPSLPAPAREAPGIAPVRHDALSEPRPIAARVSAPLAPPPPVRRPPRPVEAEPERKGPPAPAPEPGAVPRVEPSADPEPAQVLPPLAARGGSAAPSGPAIGPFGSGDPGVAESGAPPGPGSASGPSSEYRGSASPADGRGAGGGGGSAEEHYLAEQFLYIRDRVMSALAYPAVARRNGWAGTVRLAFTVRPDGGVEAIEILSGSGFRLLDRNAVEAVKRVAPLPPPPVKARIILPVSYRLKRS